MLNPLAEILMVGISAFSILGQSRHLALAKEVLD